MYLLADWYSIIVLEVFRAINCCNNELQISRTLRIIVDDCAELQYKIHLALSGMTDNHRSTLPVAQKLALLKEHAATWSELSPDILEEQKQVIQIRDGPAWELAGGVLAQCIGSNEIEYRQLPSRHRGIEKNTWTTHIPCPVRDFTMDPGQDLLAFVEDLPEHHR